MLCITAVVAAFAADVPLFKDATDAAGLGGLSSARVCFADLNADGRPDVVIDRHLVFLNRPGEGGVPRFERVEPTGLPDPGKGDVLVFADLDNDGHADAILGRSNDVNAPTYEPPPEGAPRVSCWVRGNGDGTFGGRDDAGAPAGVFHEFPVGPATTATVSVGDVDLDGRLDVYFGNWYARYGESYEAFDNTLLLQREPGVFTHCPLPTDGVTFDEDHDAGARPTYGVMIADLLGDGRPGLLDLNYGRRANRYLRQIGEPVECPRFADVAPERHLEADGVRHGRYADWVKEKIEGLEDEPPFRVHGNSFDATIGDIDRDGDLDLFEVNIRHAWAGDSSDPSRFLVQGADGAFASPSLLVLKRSQEPADHWNWGDLFAQLADLDLDGRLDLLLSSGDYPDEQRLRLFRQTDAGAFVDVTGSSGLDNDGSQQLSLADADADGDLDVLVGQTFFRYTKEQKAGRTPTLKLYLNQANETGHSLVLRLVGDGVRANRDAIGALVRVTADTDGDPDTPPETQTRLLTPIGGHAGKQMGFGVQAGLGHAAAADRVEIVWPTAGPRVITVLERVEAGVHTVTMPPG